jgi:hypothetical protein
VMRRGSQRVQGLHRIGNDQHWIFHSCLHFLLSVQIFDQPESRSAGTGRNAPWEMHVTSAKAIRQCYDEARPENVTDGREKSAGAAIRG